VRSGGPELALELEARGYAWLLEESAPSSGPQSGPARAAAAAAAAAAQASGGRR